MPLENVRREFSGEKLFYVVGGFTLKKFGIALLLVAILAIAAYAYAALSSEPKEEKRICPQCGMNAAKSPVEVKYGDVSFAALDCWSEYSTEKEISFTAAKMLDYPTATAKTRKYIGLDKAFFVEAKKLKNTMPPYIVAFAKEDAAKSFATENETQVISLSDVQSKLSSDEDTDASHEGHGDGGGDGCCASGSGSGHEGHH
jgi:hypothetical protein